MTRKLWCASDLFQTMSQDGDALLVQAVLEATSADRVCTRITPLITDKTDKK